MTMMSRLTLYSIFLTLSLNANSQRQDDWKATDYTMFIDTIKFKPVKEFKNYSIKDIKTAILSLGQTEIRQMNITGNYQCQTRNEENFEIWKLYYPRVSKEMWNKYCKGFIALMDLDGFIYHQ